MKRPSASTLRSIALFRGIPAQDLRTLLAASRIHRVDRGERVRVDERQGGVYVVLSGSASALRCQGEQETFLFSIKAGEFFGGPPLPLCAADQGIVFAGQSAFDLLELEWEDLISYIRCRPELATLVLERALSAAAEKFATLSREYFHLARQASVSDEVLQALFPPLRSDCVRTEKEAQP